MAGKHFQHREFAGGERHGFAGLFQGAGAQVEHELAELERLRGFGRRARNFVGPAAAQHGADTRHQFARIERFWQVVVGAHFEAHDTVDVLAFGGEHDDGGLVAGAAQAAADRQAVFAGQHQVQHQQVVALAQPQLVHGSGVFGGEDVEALFGEIAAQQVAQAHIVVHYHNLGLMAMLVDGIAAASVVGIVRSRGHFSAKLSY